MFSDVWAPAWPMGPLYHFLARRERSWENTLFSLFCWRRRLHCVQEWYSYTLQTARVWGLVPSTTARARLNRFRIHRVLRCTHDGLDDASLFQVFDWKPTTSQSSTLLPNSETRPHSTIYDVNAHAAASHGRKGFKWRKPASFHAPRPDLLLTPPSQVTRRTRRSRSPHRAPRRRAILAQSRRHSQLATPATHDVVISTFRVCALHRATGVPPIPPTRPRHKRLRKILIFGQAGRTAQTRSNSCVLSLFLTCHQFSTILISHNLTSTFGAHISRIREGSARRTRRLKQTCTHSLHWCVHLPTPNRLRMKSSSRRFSNRTARQVMFTLSSPPGAMCPRFSPPLNSTAYKLKARLLT